MGYDCSFCGALHFADKANGTGQYRSCCHFGKVKLQSRRRYPRELENPLTNHDTLVKNFRDNIRSYNSALSFASLGAHMEGISNGPYCFKIHGQVYHNTYNSNSISRERKYAKLYVIDIEMATNTRLNMASNRACLREVMESLDMLIGISIPTPRHIKTCLRSKEYKDGWELLLET
jgi:hypothetical protein